VTAPPLLAADGDLTRASFFGLGQLESQHAVDELGVDPGLFDGRAERELAEERAGLNSRSTCPGPSASGGPARPVNVNTFSHGSISRSCALTPGMSASTVIALSCSKMSTAGE
jgi:hypothetical protein